MQPTPVLLPGDAHGQRSLVGSSPWGHNKSAMAGQLSTAQRTGLLDSFLGENVFVNENVN